RLVLLRRALHRAAGWAPRRGPVPACVLAGGLRGRGAVAGDGVDLLRHCQRPDGPAQPDWPAAALGRGGQRDPEVLRRSGLARREVGRVLTRRHGGRQTAGQDPPCWSAGRGGAPGYLSWLSLLPRRL